ncbi:NfeD family protein [Pseudomarimonas salicorniae]|uniref:Nodulation protein NfeD n=1 Tax=Pseudomarimonas salicorniae TaxID=2933270 RepID=A0ABT0GLE1_9GAMM|nr:NfeD family protein [Lysobacter sp. CAU 1642]MCK7595357.1 nodulation protein NfeD [Lysobacter sp. CAU 1642]
MRYRWLAIAVLLTAWAGLQAMAPAAAPAQPGSAPKVYTVEIDGAIGPATTELLQRALREAEAASAAALVLRIDTPGGLEAATRDIDQAILSAPLPVVVWVAPAGARAASAGTFIVYASHVAAMAPGTHLGAATPVALGGGSPGGPGKAPGPTADESAPESEPGADEASGKGSAPGPATALERKAINDTAAHLRSMAELRGRNAEWAERAVREGVSLTASEALEQGVVEVLAADLDALLAALDGREVRLGEDRVVLRTAGAEIVEVEAGWRYRLLALITHPNVAYLLLLAGLYGLLLEGYNPGVLVPGVVGVICLLLAAYALQMLPVNYAGLALILLGLLLMVGELLTPSFGVLGIGGLAALVFGSVVLFDADIPGFGVSRGLIGGIALSTGALMLLGLHLLARARKRPVPGVLDEEAADAGASHAVALSDFDGHGRVRARGEVWQAMSRGPVRAGQTVRVLGMDGLVLKVEAGKD